MTNAVLQAAKALLDSIPEFPESPDHPTPLPCTTKVIGRTPSGAPLYQWDERYPDGSIKTFHEIWTSVTGQTGTTYGLSVVQNGAA